MDRVGNWIRRNPHLFCLHEHGHGHEHVNDEQAEALKMKTLDKFWLQAEQIIQRRQRRYLNKFSGRIREYL
jgi:hypothetical protein